MPRPRPPTRRDAGPPQADRLPGAVSLLAVLGLAILCLCTIPAVRTQQRLDREHAALRASTQALAGEVERLRRELRDGDEQTYLRTRATRALLHNGARYLERRDARYPRAHLPPVPAAPIATPPAK